MPDRKYYEAYDDRYRQVHGEKLQWFAESETPLVFEVIKEYGIKKEHPVLEIGCGEGRDAVFLLKKGFHLFATDISPEAISFCRKKWPEYAENFSILNCLETHSFEKYAFIYAVAVIHMLVRDEDRNGFYGFVREHLQEDGIALICTMGDGTSERASDIAHAFELQERIHEESGRTLLLASTSYRGVSFATFEKELRGNGLEIVKQGIACVEPDYGNMMYAVVRKS